MRMINGILEPMKRKFIVVYLDDIMNYSRNLVEHVVHAREVLTVLTEHGLKAKRANAPGLIRELIIASLTLTRMASTPRSISLVR